MGAKTAEAPRIAAATYGTGDNENICRVLATVDAHTPPQRYHRPVRLYYATQTRVRPPTFAVFANSPEGIKSPYKRYMVNRLRDAYGFDGAPIRIHMKRRRKLGEGEEGS